jgi:hypothetical protein
LAAAGGNDVAAPTGVPEMHDRQSAGWRLHDYRISAERLHDGANVLELVGQPVCALVLGYKDLNDRDELPHDPLLAVLDRADSNCA